MPTTQPSQTDDQAAESVAADKRVGTERWMPVDDATGPATVADRLRYRARGRDRARAWLDDRVVEYYSYSTDVAMGGSARGRPEVDEYGPM
jgi:hypothetical protein